MGFPTFWSRVFSTLSNLIGRVLYQQQQINHSTPNLTPSKTSISDTHGPTSGYGLSGPDLPVPPQDMALLGRIYRNISGRQSQWR